MMLLLGFLAVALLILVPYLWVMRADRKRAEAYEQMFAPKRSKAAQRYFDSDEYAEFFS
jgi:hypothetical protein